MVEEIIGRALDAIVPDEMVWFNTLWTRAVGANGAITAQIVTWR